MTPTFYYAIRHKPSGQLMPSLPKGRRAGGTHIELSDKTPPRLFKSGVHAKLALNHWLEGKKTTRFYGDEDRATEIVKHISSRIPADMEIVRVVINIDWMEAGSATNS